MAARKIHGLVNTRFYRQWKGIVQRTTNPKCPCYSRYGGRGIRMAQIFRENPAAMLAELGDPPKPGMTIDRINFNKGYVPGNIRWADWYTQLNNRRSSVKFDYQGKELTMSELARAIGIPYHTLNWRIKMLGWSLEKAIATPVMIQRKNVAA